MSDTNLTPESDSVESPDFSVSEDVAPETKPATKSKPATKTKTKATAPVEPAPVEPAPLVVPRAIYGKGERDDVSYSRVRDHTRTRKSLTVKHLQRRLALLGYPEADADIDGNYGALTERSVHAWQSANGHDAGAMTAEQFREIFGDDPNVNVVID